VEAQASFPALGKATGTDHSNITKRWLAQHPSLQLLGDI
jgi:hypothetical protein